MPDTATSRTIVVGVDGSVPSIEALVWAAKEAALRGSKLHAVQAWEPPVGALGIPAEATSAQGWFSEDFVQNLRQQLERTVQEAVSGVAEVDFHTSVLEGNPVGVIIDVATLEDAELLVLGSRGQGGFKTLLLGSVSEQCVRHAKCPVVVIHGSAKS